MSDDLWEVPPDEFVAARDAFVRSLRASGRRSDAAEVAALRRPSPSAWAVNVFARTDPDALSQLASLGPRLAEAQQSLDGDALRALSAQRRRVVTGLATAVQRLAAERGHPLSAAAAREVESTLEAALADPSAAEAVRTGRLVRPLERTGFGGEPVDELAARRAAARDAAARDGDQRAAAERAAAERAAAERAAAERAAAEATARAAEAAAVADEAAARARKAAVRADEAERRATSDTDEVTRLEAALASARQAAEHSAVASHAARAEAEAEAQRARG